MLSVIPSKRQTTKLLYTPASKSIKEQKIYSRTAQPESPLEEDQKGSSQGQEELSTKYLNVSCELHTYICMLMKKFTFRVSA